MRKLFLAATLVLGVMVLYSAPASAQETVQVYVTNLSKQIISPPVVASHSWQTSVVGPGSPASEGLRLQAEDGDPSMLIAELEANANVFDVAVGDGTAAEVYGC